MTLFERVVAWRDAEARAAEARGEAMFMGTPDAWYDDPYWFCPNGHVSGRYLSSEMRGPCCLACDQRVCMGPPIGTKAFAPILVQLMAQEYMDRARLLTIAGSLAAGISEKEPD